MARGGLEAIRSQNTFAISFEGEEPRTVMMVANKLASLFIEENLKVREYQAEGTSDFLSKELQAMEEQLKQKEQNIRNFRERSMGQLPQQLDANLRILERLQQQLQTTSEQHESRGGQKRPPPEPDRSVEDEDRSFPLPGVPGENRVQW